jgi:hypothetical protein
MFDPHPGQAENLGQDGRDLFESPALHTIPQFRYHLSSERTKTSRSKILLLAPRRQLQADVDRTTVRLRLVYEA